jgi:phosphatidylglycerophosphatase C
VIVAAFDFDGTLTIGDTVVPFLRRFGRPGRLAGTALRQAWPIGTGIVRRDRDRLRAIATAAALQGVPTDVLASVAARHADWIIAERLRPDTVARLAWHRRQGHLVVIVSASYEVYLDRVAQHLDVQGVAGTRLEFDDGRCTGRLLGANCRGAEKVERLRSWLAAHDLDRDQVTLWAYGDSPGDRELLESSDRPVWVSTTLVDDR